MPVLAGTAACAVGAFVLAGWFFDIRFFRQPIASASGMEANAALGFILCGASLLLRATRPFGGAATMLALLVAMVGGITASQELFGWSAGIDRLIAAEPSSAGAHPGRMS